jgi:hypothetical protein
MHCFDQVSERLFTNYFGYLTPQEKKNPIEQLFLREKVLLECLRQNAERKENFSYDAQGKPHIRDMFSANLHF